MLLPTLYVDQVNSPPVPSKAQLNNAGNKRLVDGYLGTAPPHNRCFDIGKPINCTVKT